MNRQGAIKMYKKTLLIISVVFFFIGWSSNSKVNTPICTEPGHQNYPEIVSDGSGGGIYVQRINAAGAVQWAVNGIAVCTGDYSKYDPNLASDGSGGAIIAWCDRRYETNGQDCLYAQRIDSSGSTRWQENGVNLHRSYDEVTNIQLIPDGKGGAVIAWVDFCFDSLMGNVYRNLMVQRVGAAGATQWTWYPQVCTRTNEGSQHLIANGSRGAIVTWGNYCDDKPADVYIQALDFSGTELWNEGGLAVSTADDIQDSPRAVSDGSGGAVAAWRDRRTGSPMNSDIYAQNVCANGELGDCVRPVAVISADRFGGFVPLTIQFDGSGSFDPKGKVVRWDWDLGDGSTSSKENLSHTYDNPGKYYIELRVKNNRGRWSTEAKKLVIAYSPGDLEKVEISVSSSGIKANGKGLLQVETTCYETQTDPDHEERPIPVDLGFDFSTTSGVWQDEVLFSSGTYTRNLLSGDPGTAVVSAVLDGEVLGTAQVEFTWPKPPANVTLELKENRSLFRGEYYAYLSWSANPDEVYTPATYRIYRSVDGGAFELIAEVGADVFTYADEALPGGSSYSFAVSMVDSEGDESDLSATVSGSKR